MKLQLELIELKHAGISPAFAAERKRFQDNLGFEAAEEAYRLNDWWRNSFVASLVIGKSVLDVGVGQGHFVNALAESFDGRVAGFDIKQSPKFRKHGEYEFILLPSATKLPFSHGEFDTVVCMETLEHIPNGEFEQVLDELHRIFKKRLIISVPFLEKMPLRPSHFQRFDSERMRLLFPDAEIKLLVKDSINTTPWIMAMIDR